MTTIRDIVTAALRRINVVGVGDTANASEASETLERLNDFLASAPTRDWVLLDSAGTTYTHTDLTLSEDWPLDGKFVLGMKAYLAKMMADKYGYPLSPVLMQEAMEGYNAFAHAFQTLPTQTFERSLPGRRIYW